MFSAITSIINYATIGMAVLVGMASDVASGKNAGSASNLYGLD